MFLVEAWPGVHENECGEQEQELDGEVGRHSLGLAASEVGVCVCVCVSVSVSETDRYLYVCE